MTLWGDRDKNKQMLKQTSNHTTSFLPWIVPYNCCSCVIAYSSLFVAKLEEKNPLISAI